MCVKELMTCTEVDAKKSPENSTTLPMADFCAHLKLQVKA